MLVLGLCPLLSMMLVVMPPSAGPFFSPSWSRVSCQPCPFICSYGVRPQHQYYYTYSHLQSYWPQVHEHPWPLLRDNNYSKHFHCHDNSYARISELLGSGLLHFLSDAISPWCYQRDHSFITYLMVNVVCSIKNNKQNSNKQFAIFISNQFTCVFRVILQISVILKNYFLLIIK